MSSKSIVFLSLFLMVAPIGAGAATLQQIYGNAVKATFQKGEPLRVDAKADLGLTVTPQKGAKTQTDTQLRLMLRYRKQQGTRQDSEGRLVFERIKTNDPKSSLPDTLGMPLAIEWKHLDKMAYFRLKTQEPIPELEKQLGPDAAKFLGQWLSVEGSEGSQDVKSLTTTSLPTAGSMFQSSTSNDLLDLKVVKAEKTMRRPNGDVVYRMRLAIDPATITKRQNARLAALKTMKDSATKRNQVAEIKKDAAEQRAAAKHTWIVAEVNQTKNTLERLELQGWTDSSKTNFFNNEKSKETLKFKAGITFMRDGDWEVAAPANSLDLKEVLSSLLSQMFAQAASSSSSAMPYVEGENPSAQPAVSGEVPAWIVSTLRQLYIDNANGFSVHYKDGWNMQQPDADSVLFFSDTAEKGIVPSMSIQALAASTTLDVTGNINSIWNDVYGALLQSTIEKDGAKQMGTIQIGASPVITDKGQTVQASRYILARETSEGWVSDYVLIFPNATSGKYLVYMFEEPEQPSDALLNIRDAMRQSLRILE